MRTHGSFAAGVVALGSALLLAGCSGWSYQPPMRGNVSFAPHNLGELRAAAPQNPTTFSQALTADYASFTGALHDEHHDWADADYFARKGLAASSGEVVPPENNANWLVPLEVPDKFRSQLAEGRSRLVVALGRGAGDRLPKVAARAQVSYDCWVERMEDDWKSAVDGDCHRQFLAALAQLEGKPQPAAQPAAPPAAPTHEYRVYFEFDKSALLPEAQQVLQQVARQAQQEPALRIVLVGKTDLSGSDAYNMKLSHRRAETVHDTLVKSGVAAGRIDTRWVGERQPPVPTPDGVREPRNRVVEIELH